MSKLKRKKMCKRPVHIMRCKKGFIADIIVDIWSYITFVLVVIIFAVLYKWAASKSAEKLAGFHGTMQSNYLAELYLRTPITVGDTDMTMAELIALYDYNQTMEMEKTTKNIKGHWIAKQWDKITKRIIGNTIIQGGSNPLMEGLKSVTDDFMRDNFDSFNTCYLFILEGNNFRVAYHGSLSKCEKYAKTTLTSGWGLVNIKQELDADILQKLLEGVPKESFMTYIPALDSRRDPIKLTCVYNIEKTISLKDAEVFG